MSIVSSSWVLILLLALGIHTSTPHHPAVAWAASSSSSPSWNWRLDRIHSWAPTVLAERLALTTNATILAYVATHGSNFEPRFANLSINSQWTKLSDSLQANPNGCGMHALTFLQSSTYRVLVAFRGTDFDIASPSGQCDVCADGLLWSRNGTLPPFCALYNRSQYDYATQARLYLDMLAQVFPEPYTFMLTGHSLGAGLGAFMAYARGNESCASQRIEGALVYSTPAFLSTLQRFTSIELATADRDRVAIVADEFDPLWVNTQSHAFGGAMGTLCPWSSNCSTPPSAACVECDASPKNISFSNPSCLTCFDERHTFSHYVRLVRNASLCPPACGRKPAMGCEEEALCPTTGVCELPSEH